MRESVGRGLLNGARCVAIAVVIVVGLGGTVVVPARAESDGASGNRAQERQALRERIRTGQINACITDSVIEHATEPVLVFQNHCDFPVHVTLCAKTVDQPRLYFFLAVRARADARHRLWIREGDQYRFMYNSCEKPYCMPPKPQC